MNKQVNQLINEIQSDRTIKHNDLPCTEN